MWFKQYRFYLKYSCPVLLSKPNIRPSAVASLPSSYQSKLISVYLPHLQYSESEDYKTFSIISPDRRQNLAMAFTFAAFSYIAALIIDAFLLFFSIFHVSWDWFGSI